MTEENPDTTGSSGGTASVEPGADGPPASMPTGPEQSVADRLAEIRSQRRRRNSRGLLRALGYGIGTGLLILVIGLAVVTVIIPKATGATTLTVLTGSMSPALPAGTLLIVKPEPLSDIRIGDVVTFEPNPNDPHDVISHRVVAITTGTDGSYAFTTKGDANNTADEPVMGKQVVAVLWYSVPWMGWLSNGRGWIVIIIVVALLFDAGYRLVKNRRKRAHHDDSRSA